MIKKLYLPVIALMFLLTSCSAVHWQIGESSQAFLRTNHKRQFETVRSSAEWTVYKWVNNWSYDAPYYFYFHYDALFQVDRGERAPDVIIEHR